MAYRHYGILAKLVEQNVKDLSEAELARTFSGCSFPNVCRRGVRRMIADGLTMIEVRAIAAGDDPGWLSFVQPG